MDLNHIRISPNRCTHGVFNIQTINSYHAGLKEFVLDVFNGVSIKYLNNYLVYHNLVNISARRVEERNF